MYYQRQQHAGHTIEEPALSMSEITFSRFSKAVRVPEMSDLPVGKAVPERSLHEATAEHDAVPVQIVPGAVSVPCQSSVHT